MSSIRREGDDRAPTEPGSRTRRRKAQGKLLLVAGTRPELIKLLPVWRAIPAGTANFVVLGQQKDLISSHSTELGNALHVPIRRPQGGLVELMAQELAWFTGFDWRAYKAVVVQGDTTTALVAAQAAFMSSVPVAHVEAGLRTSRPALPFPEEMNRRLISRLATWHFAPTERARDNLIAEGITEDIHVVGQTGIDAFHRARTAPMSARVINALGWAGERPIVLVTYHRRENATLLNTVAETIHELPDSLAVIWPQHPARQIARFHTMTTSQVYMGPPFTHEEMAQLIERAAVVVTDSGGVSEEACEAERPCLILRDETERPEVLDPGASMLIPSADLPQLGQRIQHLVQWNQKWQRNSRGRLGDGHAGRRIAEHLLAVTRK